MFKYFFVKKKKTTVDLFLEVYHLPIFAVNYPHIKDKKLILRARDLKFTQLDNV